MKLDELHLPTETIEGGAVKELLLQSIPPESKTIWEK